MTELVSKETVVLHQSGNEMKKNWFLSTEFNQSPLDKTRFLFITLSRCFLGCLSPLGMEDGRIKNNQIRATSPRSGLSRAIYARFNHTDGNGGWCPDQTGPANETLYSQYVQVKLDEPVRIKGIYLQGSAKGLGKVERFLINYTPNKTNPFSWRWIGNLHQVRTKVIMTKIFSWSPWSNHQLVISAPAC